MLRTNRLLKVLLAVVLLVAGGSFRAGASASIGTPTLLWSTFLGGGGWADGRAIAVDAAGNSYVTGDSYGTWGTPVHSSSGDREIFVAKVDTSGQLVWNTFLGGTGGDSGSNIVLDGPGNIYITGFSSGSWGTPKRSFSGALDCFVAKLDNSGNLVWNTFLGGGSDDAGYGLTLGANGNVYLSGSSSATWGAPAYSYTAGQDGFVAKLNSSGQLIWNTFFGTSAHDGIQSMVLDENANIFIAGYSGAIWGAPIRPYAGGYDSFVAGLSPSGSLTWNTFLGGPGDDLGGAKLALDEAGNFYVIGHSENIWGEPVQSSAGPAAFLARLTHSGALTWHTFMGGDGNDPVLGLALDGSGNIFVAGTSTGTWGNPGRSISGLSDAFIAGFNSSGYLEANIFLGGSGWDYGNGLAIDSNGILYISGRSYVAWGTPVRSYSGNDAFIAKVFFPYFDHQIYLPMVVR